MSGQYYCNGEIPDCPDKADCYKAGGLCRCTKDINYAVKRPETIKGRLEESDMHETIISDRRSGGCIIPAIVSIIAAFATTLIITLVKML